ncbi:MAG: phosphoenolpyruvate--protein phosphotransferase [Betaproteobacteria bacterium RIFCSPLOWO2_02_67_12]|nr:MAG: phosphoenolpyruvate--protein phosphotransferase [Betaproteobacteria bacterium RIFCSPLOWO2_02_67_12]OGA26650.1 MAG: phosphoenolpyruvate--protein phosphotransferase [Betaproteobacteria bacterium RIFCSPLOWO2_02_FULL_68_150]OGA57203.1 MAG: phosphoenolpyruvate--protein phosphotransferase [Betaproteobacteria bacterium RIFCSPLOWO2_12_FULL_67_28]
MNFALHGAPVSPGITIGRAHLVSSARLEVAHYAIPDESVPAEVFRFDAAIARAKQDLSALEAHIAADAPQEFGAFIELHRMILEDSSLSHVPRELIRERKCNAEWALVQQMETLVEQFERADDAYLRERRHDIEQVVERVLKALAGEHGLGEPPLAEEARLIVVAHDLSPADMMLFKRHQFGGFVTDVGGVTSHTAILARSLDIPAIVGLHFARHMIRENDLLIVDGIQGVLVVDPDPLVLAEYQLRQSQHELERKKLRRLRRTPAATLEGTPVELHANIELPQDVKQVHEAGAQGIGLFRTEFLFLNRRELPSEDEQFEAYREVARAMDGKPVVIRTLDVGADKALGLDSPALAPNPALGLRAIRFCLAEPQIFLVQLRAILRASHYGRVSVLLPMLAHAHEIEQALNLLRQAKEQLSAAGARFLRGIKVGGMIEIPAAALALPMLMRRLDFLSIGTNDLIQYTLAIDRTDDAVAHLYDPVHPAVLQLIAHTIQTAGRGGTPVAVCGEMAGDAGLTRLLLGMGLRNFSMHPAQLPAIKERILRTSLEQAQPLAQRLLRATDPEKIRELLAQLNA